MIATFPDLLLAILKGAGMVAGFFGTLCLAFGIIILPFLLVALIVTACDGGSPPEY